MPKQQTVQKIRAKLEARRDQYYSTPVFYNILTIEVFQKSNLDLKLTQALSCESRHTGITCVLDCDGGSVAISSLGKDRRIDSLNDVLKLSNNGVFVQGGCGDSRQNVLLDRTEGGDDVFKLVELPASECDSITYDYVDEEEEDLL